MTKAWKEPSMHDELVIDRRNLVPFVATMKVWELAQLAGTSVDAVVSKVVIRARLPVFPGMKGAKKSVWRQVARSKAASASHEGELEAPVLDEPELARLLGRATRREIKDVVDRWVLGRVLEACEWNITYAAKRLEVSRRRVRQRWAAVRAPRVGARLAELTSSGPPMNEPAGPSLAKLLDQGATHREIHSAVDRWLVDRTLAAKGGNLTHAAKLLNVSRRSLRKRRQDNPRPVPEPEQPPLEQHASQAAPAPTVNGQQEAE